MKVFGRDGWDDPQWMNSTCSTPQMRVNRMAAPMRPIADDLAGVPVCIEENDPTVRLRSPQVRRTRDRAACHPHRGPSHSAYA